MGLGEELEDLLFAIPRRAVLYFVDRIEVVDRRVLRVHFKVPFDNNGIKLLTDEVVGLDGAAGNGVRAGGTDVLADACTWPTTREALDTAIDPVDSDHDAPAWFRHCGGPEAQRR